MLKHTPLILFACSLLCLGESQATTYSVSSEAGLQSALAAVKAGDEIVLASNAVVQYSNGAVNGSCFYSNAEGRADAPITIRSQTTTNLAEIRGNDTASKIVLRIEGDHWIVRDLIISGGQKGLVFDNSNNSQAIDLEVYNVGYEGIHVRDGSDNVLIDGCHIHDTGVNRGQFGEGIYIGTDRASWSTYDPYVNNTKVTNCVIGPNVGAEALDIKEGTYNTIVEYNEIVGTGISAEAYEDSFIDVKGARTIIRYNTFTQGNEPKILRGIAVIDRDVELSSYEHVVHDNVFNMDDATTPLVEAYSGTSDVYAFANRRNPSGTLYNNRVIEGQAPFYSPGGSSNAPPAVALTAPSSDQTIPAGTTLTLSASATDTDGSIASVSFFVNAQQVGTADTSLPYSREWSASTPGVYSVTAVATDNDGATATSSARSVTVQSQGGGSASSLVLLYQEGDGGSATNNRLKPFFVIRNDGASAVPLSELRIRYYFTLEGGGTPVFACDYAAIGKEKVSGSFTSLGGAAYYLEVTFSSAAGSVAANGNSGDVKVRIRASNWANQNESNDASYDASHTTYAPHSDVVLLRNGTVVYGSAP